MNYTYTSFILFSKKYKFTSCSKLVNTNTGSIIKKVYNNGCIGYNIDRKFKSKTFIDKNLEDIKELKDCSMSDDCRYLINQLEAISL